MKAIKRIKTLPTIVLGMLVAFSTQAETSYIDDGTLAAKIIAKFLTSPAVSSLDIKTHVYRGEIELCGFVENKGQIEDIFQTAQSVEGVGKIHNGMDIKTATDSTQIAKDALITGKVKAAFLKNKNVPSSRISVITDDGRVQLCGFLYSDSAIREAVKLAGQVQDVKSVDNKLLKIIQ